ncbi:acyl-CoA thioesterase domain-containing protein [Nocardia cerradoensis]|uniref:acyl-CoA thioesterase domain-containing protein n=1 Tax=Nocardia cerradoensis TaxID=85688 RepID=UPI0002F7C903|nr:acyl-CoA thioesterase domain-containing protein [Nocardia cerradoensis]NKY45455.1 thioesterase family protein [Nocardia cerradoensis]
MNSAFFRVKYEDTEELHPEPRAGSGWGADQMRGPAVSAALAREVERTVETLGRPDLQPVRWTLDLFRAVRMRPSVTSAAIVREGPRLCLVDAVLTQDGEPAARASALFLRPSEAPPGQVWSGGTTPTAPAAGRRPTRDPERLYHTESEGWGEWTDAFRDSPRKRIWHFAIPVVDGEEPTPFQFAASVADVTNMVSNLGSAGLEYINPDVTMAITRLPAEREVGLALTERVEHHGLAVGTAVMFDRDGVLGTTTVSAIANARRAVRIDRGRD